MTVELLRDALRDDSWWLIVNGSEQSFVDTTDPLHLEFEYVQMMSHLLDTLFVDDVPLSALHLGGGLCTVPRWLAHRHPGSRQRVVEHSAQIAELAVSIGRPPLTEIVVADAAAVAARSRSASRDLIVCDIYDGPETVVEMFTLDATRMVKRVLRPDGVYLCNVSDMTPFAMSRVVVATLQQVFGTVVMMAEPPVIRGRRSGNLVLMATDRAVDLGDLRRRAAGGIVRSRVVAGDDLAEFMGTAEAAVSRADIPPSGERPASASPLHSSLGGSTVSRVSPGPTRSTR